MELAVADPVLLEPPEPGQQNPDSDEPMAFVQMRHFFPGIRVSSRLSPPSRPQDRLNNQIDRLTLPRPLYETIPTSEDMSLRIPPESNENTNDCIMYVPMLEHACTNSIPLK